MMLILDDHPLVRQGIESVIHLYKSEEKIIHAGCVKEAIKCMENYSIDITFVDINLGVDDGFSFVDWLKENGYDTKIFFITSYSRESDFEYAKKINADAYILKEDFIDDIIYGIKVVERGGKFFSPSITDKMTNVSHDEQLVEALTDREREVLFFLSNGYSNGKIGKELYISEGTVKRHVTNILDKLELKNRSEAIIFANNNQHVLKMAIKLGIKGDRRVVQE